MPRQDVPYGGAICRLKERIAEIWDELGKKLHSINGVEGDAAGDVKIVSGDAAVTISESQVGHYIEIGLDHGNLPSAAVSSVNGQTGAVALDAGDIPSDGNSDVQTDIDVNKAAISACSSAITSEQLARQNADSTLQTNINTLSASLPSAAAAAVAADPTVAQLVTDMAGKVDLSDVSTVETPYTIAKRNGSGRLVAADPASGATDKTLVTANWVSQTGDSGPNNLIHKTGNETKAGNLTMTNDIRKRVSRALSYRPPSYIGLYSQALIDPNDDNILRYRIDYQPTSTGVGWQIYNSNNQGTRKSVQLMFSANHNTGSCALTLITSTGNYINLATWNDPDLIDR